MKPGSKIGYLMGFLLSAGALLFLVSPGQERLMALGPANTGHEELACSDCHEPAPGTARQQIQANVRAALGWREQPVDFQHEDVTSADCLACHERPNDNHPIFRFNEPRFAEARAAIEPNSCISCHLEHKGARVTIEPTYCVNCHEDLTLKNDPIDIPHETLVTLEQWDTCLGCHDFHGNHVMEVPQSLEEALGPQIILDYFAGADSPYSSEKLHQAKEQR